MLKVEINSSLDILPDFIEGQIRVDGEYDLTLGNYRKDGQRLDSYAAEIQSFNIHPLPFSQEGQPNLRIQDCLCGEHFKFWMEVFDELCIILIPLSVSYFSSEFFITKL